MADEKAEDAQMLDAIVDAMAPDVTDDVEAAFAQESYTWSIPTGRTTDDGKLIYLSVVVKDPQRTELPTQYIDTLRRKGADEAAIGLWQACIVTPVALKNPVNFKRTTTALRATLTYRLLSLVGVNGDFFGALVSMDSRAPPRATTSSSKSPPASPSTPATSSPSPPPTSSAPTTLPGSDGERTVLTA